MTVDSTPNENPADHDRTARRWRNGMDHAGGRLVAVCGSTFMLLIDIYIVQVALPTIHRRLGGSFTDLQWVIDRARGRWHRSQPDAATGVNMTPTGVIRQRATDALGALIGSGASPALVPRRASPA